MLLYLQVALAALLLFFGTCNCQYSQPSEYILSYPTGDNYLNISYDNETKSNNYFIVIGDWGASLTELEIFMSDERKCNDASQRKVGKRIQQFIADQEEIGKKLLFFVLVGDNFYYRGNNGSNITWEKQWHEVYGNYTRDYYWFTIMGNHDWLNDDPFAMCPWNNTKHAIEYEIYNNITQETKTIIMPYGSNQLIKSKGGSAPEKYYMPDFSYYYTINDLNFELLMLDTNGNHCPDAIYWDVLDIISMGDDSYKNCGNYDIQSKEELELIAQQWLLKLTNSTHIMMQNRGKKSLNKNFLLANHYPEEGNTWLDEFIELRLNSYNGLNNTENIIVSIFGHTHDQQCNGTTIDMTTGKEYCNRILCGGGGGCCDIPLNIEEQDGGNRGFYVFEFDDNGKLTQPYDILSDVISSEFDCGESWENVNDFNYSKYCDPNGDQIVASPTFSFCNNTDYWDNETFVDTSTTQYYDDMMSSSSTTMDINANSGNTTNSISSSSSTDDSGNSSGSSSSNGGTNDTLITILMVTCGFLLVTVVTIYFVLRRIDLRNAAKEQEKSHHDAIQMENVGYQRLENE